MLESTLLSVRQPSRRTLTAFRNVFNNSGNPRGGFSALGGHSAKVLDDSGDLMALRTRIDEDRLTSFLRHCAPILFVVSRERTSSPRDLSHQFNGSYSRWIDSMDRRPSCLYFRTPPPHRCGHYQFDLGSSTSFWCNFEFVLCDGRAKKTWSDSWVHDCVCHVRRSDDKSEGIRSLCSLCSLCCCARGLR